MRTLKITLIGSGSVSFAPPTIRDILLNERINSVDVDLTLMDIAAEPLELSRRYAQAVAEKLHRGARIHATTSLTEAVKGSDFVVTAIEKNRYYYWSQDFHIPRKYGSVQIYGENGGPGGMFHTLRNLGPMLEIARAMEKHCPQAWLINYTNPEAKLVEAISRLTAIRCVGLCHGIGMGLEQLSKLLEVPEEDLDVAACGLNHFGWFQSIKSKSSGEDLYPRLRQREREADWLAEWDEIGLSRLMLRLYGLYPYPGANHIGEYVRWAEQFLAGQMMQYFYDPATEDPWKSGKIPEFVYSTLSIRERTLYQGLTHDDQQLAWEAQFELDAGNLQASQEVGIPIIESIAFDVPRALLAVNMPNRGYIPGIQEGMAVELPADVDGKGIHPRRMQPLPEAITEMIRLQGAIHKLVIDAFVEGSKNALLQAILLDPTVSSYAGAVGMLEELCEKQKDILPRLEWKNRVS